MSPLIDDQRQVYSMNNTLKPIGGPTRMFI